MYGIGSYQGWGTRWLSGGHRLCTADQVDCVLLVIARAQAMVGMDAHECWRLPRRGQVPRAYLTIVCVTTASAGTAIVQGPLGSIRGLDINGLKLWPVQDLDSG